MQNFKEYARYYDLLYKGKNYENETAYVINILKRYAPNVKDILNLGCGTGRHDNYFYKQGIKIDGVDISPEMISIARSTITVQKDREYFVGDIRSWIHPARRKYDSVISLFHVMSYLITNEDFNSTLDTVRDHLTLGGYFIFDFWYGPAVYAQRPQNRAIVVEDDDLKIIRLTKSKFDDDTSVTDITFDINVIDKIQKRLLASFTETHKMRCYFINELKAILGHRGFEIENVFEWEKLTSPNKDSWNALVICKKS